MTNERMSEERLAELEPYAHDPGHEGEVVAELLAEVRALQQGMTEEYSAAIPSPDDRTKPRLIFGGVGWTKNRAEAQVVARRWAEYGGALVRRHVTGPEWMEDG